MSKTLTQMVIDLEPEELNAEVKRRLQAGEDALAVMNECKDGMVAVGDRFAAGDAFLAELVLSGELFKGAMEIINPYLSAGNTGPSKGKVLLATLKGDIHYLGKGIVATLLKAYGFEVEDVGEDVPPETFVERMKEYQPDFCGFSSLLTPNMKEMKKAVDIMVEQGLRNQVKVMIGGGITTEQTRVYVGADFQAVDAMETVNWCLKQVAC